MTRDTLTREQIVKAAVDLLDDEGLDGFSMRTLGKRLGSAATAVYWHVGSKDNLVALAGDQVWQEVTLPDLVETDWRAAARRMAIDLHATLVRHPWLVQVFSSLVTYGPGKARHDDHLLAIYESAGFTGADVDQAATAVLTYVLGNALGPAAEASITKKLGEELLRDSMAKAEQVAMEFPRLRARLDTTVAGYGAGPENSFEFGLEALLDGLGSRR
jgi:AcrR family transcriptional regulator